MKINKMLLVSSVVLSMLLMAACGNEKEKAPETVQSTDQETNQTEETDQVQKEQNPMVDEAKYEGEEKELVKILNLSTKYRNEGNEKEYMGLVSNEPNTPINQMNANKIVDMQVESIDGITDTQGTISANVTLEGSEPGLNMYVFHKVDGMWKIYDID
ncbi:hypothetical protein [Paenibacillus sp. TC-CSREp1]|uniref:hypothetical protein n=1 Tax=Paenibacillus sp. TC-CSREp1 TaxID=3410089 RepID=UPI003CF6DE81